ncbi:MAG: RHS repeat-associated core domain-containing protein [Clostridia bacterium]|nr:RHS repeat-associated core domain-containing protein [Clostridia bacterium]
MRYRGYYYDAETGFYYLQSRYYDPVTCRFISADSAWILTATPMGLTDKNLYAYCLNNPVNICGAVKI